MEKRNGGHLTIWEPGPQVGQVAMPAGGESNRIIYTKITVFHSIGFMSSIQASSMRQTLACDTTPRGSYPGGD